MTAPSFANRSAAVHTTTVQALLGRSNERLPLEAGLQLAHEVASAISLAHEVGVVLGQLDASTLEIDETGAVQVLSGHGAVLAPELGHGGTADVRSDVYAVGCVLFEIFTGLTPAQAKARLAVTALHTMPSAARFNPTLDEGLAELVASMLAREPADRPASMHLVQARVLAAFDELGLEPSREALADFVNPRPTKRDRVQTQPFIPVVVSPPLPVVPTVVVAMPPVQARPASAVARAALVSKPAPKKPAHRAPPRSWQTVDAEDAEESLSEENVVAWRQTARFDGWAVGAVGFAVVAMTLALVL